MNIFKYIIEHLFKRKKACDTLKLQEQNEVKPSYMDNKTKKDFLKSLKSQVISNKKEIEIKERSGDGFGFKKNISC